MRKGYKLQHKIIVGNDRARLLQRTDITETCWLWQGPLDKDGYAPFGMLGRRMNAHTASFILHVGPVPERHEIHHTCRVRHCVNPRHLEALPEGVHAAAPLGDYCHRGHPREPGTFQGHRRCRTCAAEKRARMHFRGRPRTQARRSDFGKPRRPKAT